MLTWIMAYMLAGAVGLTTAGLLSEDGDTRDASKAYLVMTVGWPVVLWDFGMAWLRGCVEDYRKRGSVKLYVPEDKKEDTDEL